MNPFTIFFSINRPRCHQKAVRITIIQHHKAVVADMLVVDHWQLFRLQVMFNVTDCLSNEVVSGDFVHRLEDLKHCLHLLLREY